MNHQNFSMQQIAATMTEELSEWGTGLKAFHEDERGDNENLGRMLILALILVPIVILLTIFGNDIYTAGEKQWKAVMETDVGAGTAAKKTTTK